MKAPLMRGSLYVSNVINQLNNSKYKWQLTLELVNTKLKYYLQVLCCSKTSNPGLPLFNPLVEQI